jgi:hypothetical protein
VDKTRDVAFVAGQGDTGKHIDKLVSEAIPIVNTHQVIRSDAQWSSYARLVGLVTTLVLFILVVLSVVYQRRRQRPA